VEEIYTVDRRKRAWSLDESEEQIIISEFDDKKKWDVLMHKLPKLEVLKQKFDVVGPDDIAKGDVDLPRHAMCHHLGW
jgi:hypothetical protein